MESLLTPQLAAVLDSRTGPVIGYRTIRLDPGSPAVFVATARMAQRPTSHDHGEIEVNSGAGLTETDARCLAERLTDALRRARIKLDPADDLAQVLAFIEDAER